MNTERNLIERLAREVLTQAKSGLEARHELARYVDGRYDTSQVRHYNRFVASFQTRLESLKSLVEMALEDMNDGAPSLDDIKDDIIHTAEVDLWPDDLEAIISVAHDRYHAELAARYEVAVMEMSLIARELLRPGTHPTEFMVKILVMAGESKGLEMDTDEAMAFLAQARVEIQKERVREARLAAWDNPEVYTVLSWVLEEVL